MRFDIEKTHLSHDHGRSILPQAHSMTTFHVTRASTANEAARKFVRRNRAVLVSDVLELGSEAIATAEKNGDLFLIRLYRTEEN